MISFFFSLQEIILQFFFFFFTWYGGFSVFQFVCGGLPFYNLLKLLSNCVMILKIYCYLGHN